MTLLNVGKSVLNVGRFTTPQKSWKGAEMQLREYQEQDLENLLKHDAMCLFNEQRTGKTPTSILCMERRGVKRLLVICPASMVYKWKEEFETWTGKKAYVVPVPKVLEKKGGDFTADAWVINYECHVTLHRYQVQTRWINCG